MKKNIVKYLLILATTLSIGSCEDYVDNLNTDPNAFLDTPAELMVQGIMLSNQFWQNGTAARLSMIWMNQATGSDRQYIALNNWNSITAADFNDPWAEAYAGTVSQAQIAQEKALTSNNEILAGLAQVLEAYSLGMAASLWGDVPYEQANNADQFLNPEYDSQTEVYNTVQIILDEAIERLQSGLGGIPESQDIYFGGNATNWIAIAHSLKARFYLHTEDYQNAIDESILGINDPTGDLIAQFGSTFGLNFNPFYDFTVYQRDGYMSAIDAYAPRLLDPTSDIYRGNSKTDESARFNYIYLDNENIYNSGYEINFTNLFDGWGAEGKFGENIQMLTYGEMLLIQAEAQARLNGLDAGLTAYNLYRQLIDTGYGISTNTYGGGTFNYDDYDTTDFASGGIENPDNISPEQALLREILEERYVYFAGHFESFTDFRRTGNIAEIELKSGFDNSPQRFLYSQSEINSNTNVPNPIPTVSEPTPVYQ